MGVVTWMGLNISDAEGAGRLSEGKCRSDRFRDIAKSDSDVCDGGSNHRCVGVGGKATVGTLPKAGGGAVGERGVRGSASLLGVGVKVILSSFKRAKGDDEPGRSHSVCRLSTIRDGVWTGGGEVFSGEVSGAAGSDGAAGCTGGTTRVGATTGMLKMSPEEVDAGGLG